LFTARIRASKKSIHAAEQQRPDIARKRASWRKHQPQIGIERLVFIDETWTKTNMAPLRGWCRKGQRLVAHVPHGHWKTMTFVAALRHDRIDAPCVFDGPINGESFLHYVEQILKPRLKPNDIVIMDNLGSHKSDAVRNIIRSVGAKLFFLPPYSPDLNPIEQAFSKFKHGLRKAKERTIEGLWKRIGTLIPTLTKDECKNYFINAGWTGLES
jgi:transposase